MSYGCCCLVFVGPNGVGSASIHVDPEVAPAAGELAELAGGRGTLLDASGQFMGVPNSVRAGNIQGCQTSLTTSALPVAEGLGCEGERRTMGRPAPSSSPLATRSTAQTRSGRMGFRSRRGFVLYLVLVLVRLRAHCI